MVSFCNTGDSNISNNILEKIEKILEFVKQKKRFCHKHYVLLNNET